MLQQFLPRRPRGQPELAETLYLDHVPILELPALPFLDIPTIHDSSSETRNGDAEVDKLELLGRRDDHIGRLQVEGTTLCS